MPPRDKAEDITITAVITFCWLVSACGFIFLVAVGPNYEVPSWPLGAAGFTILFVVSTIALIWWWRRLPRMMKEWG
jgi:hypothetical protein